MLILFILFIAITLAAMLFLLPYDLRWTAKLICRDIRNLRTKYTTRSRHECKPVDGMTSAPVHEQDEMRGTSQLPEGVEYDNLSPEHVSESSVYFTAPQDGPKPSSDECPGTLYRILEDRLRAVYASRDRDMSHQDRWKFRGSWLLLYKAIQACPSNDSDEILRDDTKAASENMMLLEMLTVSTKQTQSCTPKVSKMPAAPYTQHDSNQDRFDSMFGDTPTPPSPPSPAQIWLSILEAADNATKIAPMAEELVEYVWPEKSTVDIIEQIGNPHKMFSDADDAELRAKLRRLLCPEFLSSTPQC